MTKSKNYQDSFKDKDYQMRAKLFDNLIYDNEPLLTKKEIADFLNVSVKMIDKRVFLNEIPYIKIGRLVRFSKQRVLAWAEETTLRR